MCCKIMYLIGSEMYHQGKKVLSVMVVVTPYTSSCGSLEIVKGTEDSNGVTCTRAAVRNTESSEQTLEEEFTV